MTSPINRSAEVHSPKPLCTQPQCALRQLDFNRTQISEMLISAIAAEDAPGSVPDEERIMPREVCIECAVRVLRGQRPFLTEDETVRDAVTVVALESARRANR